MRYRLGLLFLSLLLAVPAFAGTLLTRAGQTLEGDLQLAADHIHITPASGPARDIPLNDVLEATFAPTAAAPVTYGKTRREVQPTGPANVFVEYFADTEFKNRLFARYESSISFYRDRKSVLEPGLPQLPTVRFTTQVVPRSSEDYTFIAEVRGPARLWVDGKLRIDQSGAHGSNKFSVTIPLKAGKPVPLRMEVLPGTTTAEGKLIWSSRATGRTTVASEFLRRPDKGPQDPELRITSPQNDAQLRNPESIRLQVNVGHEGGKILRVDYLAGADLIASAEAAPFQADWKQPPAGHYVIRARALDEHGVTGYSEPIAISVADAGENQSLPAPWGQQALGKKEVRIPGKASFADETFTLTKAGGQITEDDDTPLFVYQSISGDFQFIAHLASLTPADNTVGPLAGIMLRENMTGRDRLFALVVNPQSTLLARRPDYWGRTLSTDRNDPRASWLKIVRYGNRVRAYTSSDGRAWSLYGSERIEFPERVYAGLCAMARNKQTPAVARFDHVSIIPGSPEFVYGVEGILFRSGTFLAADIAGMKDDKITYTHNHKRTTTSSAEVARLIYKPVPAELAEKIPDDRMGVALASGDFIDGDIKEVSYRVTVSNLVFGPRTFGLKTNEVLAIYVKHAGAPELPYVVTATDGSVYQGKAIKIEKDSISLEDPTLGAVTLATRELAQLKHN
jgi:hypothetical protein